MADTPQQSESPAINLKDPIMAALLAWLVPGLGHWYQGRRAKAVLFFVCIMGLFCYGVYLGGGTVKDADGQEHKLGYGRAVYLSTQRDDMRLYFIGQIGVGLPAFPALYQAYQMNNNRAVILDGFMAPPRPANIGEGYVNADQPTAHDLYSLLNHAFELATIFTSVAGLLNILVIYDAFAGPFVPPPPAKKEEEPE